MRNKFLSLLIISILLTSCSESCESPVTDEKTTATISVVNWNVQTFFDAETSGNEYKDFQSAARWSRDKYLARLQRLCQVITTLNADVYVFEELENEGILYDISNQLAGNVWDTKKNWTYGGFTKDADSSIGSGILSRFPVMDLKAHTIDIKTQNAEQPSVRPLMQANLEIDGKELIVLGAHWKSKSGGQTETEIWRDWQEFVAAEKIMELYNNNNSSRILVCGDLNRDIRDFVCVRASKSREPNVLLRGTKNVGVYSPWFNLDGSYSTETGSYYFNNNWERIDNFFDFGNLQIISFSAKAEDPWALEDKIPYKYTIYTGEGYSDHLPIVCMVKLS